MLNERKKFIHFKMRKKYIQAILRKSLMNKQVFEKR